MVADEATENRPRLQGGEVRTVRRTSGHARETRELQHEGVDIAQMFIRDAIRDAQETERIVVDQEERVQREEHFRGDTVKVAAHQEVIRWRGEARATRRVRSLTRRAETLGLHGRTGAAAHKRVLGQHTHVATTLQVHDAADRGQSHRGRVARVVRKGVGPVRQSVFQDLQFDLPGQHVERKRRGIDSARQMVADSLDLRLDRLDRLLVEEYGAFLQNGKVPHRLQQTTSDFGIAHLALQTESSQTGHLLTNVPAEVRPHVPYCLMHAAVAVDFSAQVTMVMGSQIDMEVFQVVKAPRERLAKLVYIRPRRQNSSKVVLANEQRSNVVADTLAHQQQVDGQMTLLADLESVFFAHAVLQTETPALLDEVPDMALPVGFGLHPGGARVVDASILVDEQASIVGQVEESQAFLLGLPLIGSLFAVVLACVAFCEHGFVWDEDTYRNSLVGVWHSHCV